VQTSPAYHWRIIDADNLALYLDGRQVGGVGERLRRGVD